MSTQTLQILRTQHLEQPPAPEHAALDTTDTVVTLRLADGETIVLSRHELQDALTEATT